MKYISQSKLPQRPSEMGNHAFLMLCTAVLFGGVEIFQLHQGYIHSPINATHYSSKPKLCRTGTISLTAFPFIEFISQLGRLGWTNAFALLCTGGYQLVLTTGSEWIVCALVACELSLTVMGLLRVAVCFAGRTLIYEHQPSCISYDRDMKVHPVGLVITFLIRIADRKILPLKSAVLQCCMVR